MIFSQTGCRTQSASTIRSGGDMTGLRAFFRRFRPTTAASAKATDLLWQEIAPPLWRSVRLIDGRRSQQTGKLWRRRAASGAWEYRQDPETLDEFLDRQW